MDATPNGWHLPTSEEWNDLIAYVGSPSASSLLEGGSSGLDLLMGGYNYGGGFQELGAWGMYWSSTLSTSDHARAINVLNSNSEAVISGADVNAGASVRYVRD